ncbi:MAG: GNAT family N-acetyltransferase [Eubacterium sp.]|nr:GNAT family N-acetyltransferase [Eubacterium sp.]
MNAEFERIETDELILLLAEKNPGDGIMLPFYYYDIIRKSDNAVVGKISVRIGRNFHSYYNGNIGYEVYEQYRGNCYAYKACVAVLTVAKAEGMDYIYITCAESNKASYKTIEKLGAKLFEICEVPQSYFAWHEGMERQRIYRLVLK